MKLHVGVDSKKGIIHSMATTPANVHDSQKWGSSHMVRSEASMEIRRMQQKHVIREKAPRAKDFTNARAYRNKPLWQCEKEKNRRK
jgi:IS5 family transposase